MSQPWILTDQETGTQLPLSYRGYEGAFYPRDLGMSDEGFVSVFGRHLPGGPLAPRALAGCCAHVEPDGRPKMLLVGTTGRSVRLKSERPMRCLGCALGVSLLASGGCGS